MKMLKENRKYKTVKSYNIYRINHNTVQTLIEIMGDSSALYNLWIIVHTMVM